ncbi:MAG: glycoside hydrolase family protein [Hyphomicrobiales bacterium]|nr:glycoside hydrolase family protein [Hyphomicrobiales bacterium]
MKTSEAGVRFIADHEGVVTRAYRDVAGVWTIGVGHTAAAGEPKPKAGMTITRQRAFDLLRNDLPKYEGRVQRVLGWVKQHVFDGAVSFDFNTGKIDGASWVTLLKTGRVGEAKVSLMQWVNAGGKRVKGLVNRRLAERTLIFRGRYAPASAAGPDEHMPKFEKVGYTPTVRESDAEYPYSVTSTVRNFQAVNGLVVDGKVGPATMATLDRRISEQRAGRAIGGLAVAGGAIGGLAGPEPLLYGLGSFIATAALAAAAYQLWHFRGAIALNLKLLLER